MGNLSICEIALFLCQAKGKAQILGQISIFNFFSFILAGESLVTL